MDWTKTKPVGGSKYGLQLKIVSPAAKKPQLKKPLPFSLDSGGDEDTVEDEIARQASKKQSASEVDVQIKQALQQDASAFDYDEVYDHMKGKQAQPIREDRAKREPKYIGKLLDKAKVRAVEHDIAYENRLAKEREKEDHLFGDKEKFVTSAYKKKLIEQGKWKEEERLRELREKEHEVAGKRDMGDFYRNLLKNNVAFGGKETGDGKGRVKGDKTRLPAELDTSPRLPDRNKETSTDMDERTSRKRESHEENLEDGGSPAGEEQLGVLEEGSNKGLDQTMAGRDSSSNPVVTPIQNSDDTSAKKELLPDASKIDHKSREDSLAAAKERYLARKKQRNL